MSDDNGPKPANKVTKSAVRRAVAAAYAERQLSGGAIRLTDGQRAAVLKIGKRPLRPAR